MICRNDDSIYQHPSSQLKNICIALLVFCVISVFPVMGYGLDLSGYGDLTRPGYDKIRFPSESMLNISSSHASELNIENHGPIGLVAYPPVMKLPDAGIILPQSSKPVGTSSRDDNQEDEGDVSIHSSTPPGISWEKNLGGSSYDKATCIQQTNDGGYIVAGESSSMNGDVSGNHGKDDFWIVKLGKSQENPIITSITPVSGYNSGNVAVTIKGTNFKSGATVKLARGSIKKEAQVKKITSTLITCTLPITRVPAGKYNLTVRNSDGTTVTKVNAFTVKQAGPKPTITAIKPNTGTTRKNTAVVITGTNFRTGIIVQMIKNSDVKNATISKRTATKIVCTFPTKGAAAGKWNVKMTNTDGTTSTGTGGFTVTRTVSGIETKSGQVDGVVLNSMASMPSPAVSFRGSAFSYGPLTPINAPMVSGGVLYIL